MLKRLVAFGVVVTALSLGTAIRADAATGSQRFLVSASNAGGSVWATGPIAGAGTDVVLGQNQDRFVFKGGSVLVNHQATGGSDHFNPITCTVTFTETGVYQLASGTGAYAGVSGGGTYSARGVGVGHRTADGCSEPRVRFVVTARGVTNLP